MSWGRWWQPLALWRRDGSVMPAFLIWRRQMRGFMHVCFLWFLLTLLQLLRLHRSRRTSDHKVVFAWQRSV